MGNLAEIKRMIFDTDDKACFIENEHSAPSFMLEQPALLKRTEYDV